MSAWRAQSWSHGPQIRSDGTVRFRLWAPACETIQLEILGDPEARPMARCAEGWHELIAKAAPGKKYRFILPGGKCAPDPASRYQPEDVHGPSELVEVAQSAWNDLAWTGRPWEETVLYELHIGAFTSEGTFLSAIDKLDHLAALGVTAIEIMPVADFPGKRNWGYDGVLPYAPDSSYGRPEDFRALIEAAHARRMMVFLDVVYNHFGPEGNYLSLYAPQFFTDRYITPWGPALNFDGPDSRAVRDFVIENALYWVQQFHLDGLRLDAIHAIFDSSSPHIIDELSQRVRAAVSERCVHLILENERNDVRFLLRDTAGNAKYCTAQWNDDVHHVLHAAATGESSGYYVDYHGDSQKLGRALAEGFAFQGELSPYGGGPRGTKSSFLPPEAFIAFLQNHDQIGNRAFGDRIQAITSCAAVRAAACVYLLLPQIPLIFMGEEWGSPGPFPFFCDFGPDLAAAVREGRRNEFSRFPEFQDPAARARIPDPQSEKTFESARLDWGELDEPSHKGWLDWYQRMLETRRNRILPLIGRIDQGGEFRVLGPEAVEVRWRSRDGVELVLSANLSDTSVSEFRPSRDLIWAEGTNESVGSSLGPWSVLWSIGVP